MHALLKTMFLFNMNILFWSGATPQEAVSAEAVGLEQHPRLQLAQFSNSPSNWPGTGTFGQESTPSGRPERKRPQQSPVPLPSRRPVVEADAGEETASEPGLFAEEPPLNGQDRGPRQAGKTADQTEEQTPAVSAADDPAWQQCSMSVESTEDARTGRIQACTEILARSPPESGERRWAALRARAAAYGGFNHELAIDDYSALLTLNPDDTEILFERSHLYASQQNYEAAIADLDRVVALEPGNAKAFGERGRVHEQKGDTASAEKDYRKATEIDPANQEYASSLQKFIKIAAPVNENNSKKETVIFDGEDKLFNLCSNFSDTPEKRIESCNAVIAKLPALEMESALYSAEKTSDITESLDKASVAVGYDTTWMLISSAIGLRAIAHSDMADTESALVDINNAIDKAGRIIYRDGRASTLDYMMLFRGRLFLKNGEYDRAEDDFRKVTQVNLAPDGHAHMALLHFTRGQHDEALEEIHIALKRDPQNSTAFGIRGRISLEKGDYRLALQDCQHAVDLREASKQLVPPELQSCVEKAREALPADAKPTESQPNSNKPE